MIKLNEKKQKMTQYVVGGVVAVIVLFVWISIPLMQNSSLDSPAGPANLFRTKTADVSALGNDIPPEGGAPGYSLNGGMLNNPVTSGENIASTLFQSGPEEASATGAAADASVPGVPRPGAAASASASVEPPANAAPKSKLGTVPSITAGNSNSMTSGGTHGKFFGTGAAEKREELVLPDKGFKKPMAADKRTAMMSALQEMEGQSSLAARSFGAAASRSGASAAFERGGGAGATNLSTDLEKSAMGSGMELGEAAQDLKSNDPHLGKKNINFPTPKPEPADEDEAMKRMIMQMLLSSLIGGLFSGK
jgi:hypothetical protein